MYFLDLEGVGRINGLWVRQPPKILEIGRLRKLSLVENIREQRS